MAEEIRYAQDEIKINETPPIKPTEDPNKKPEGRPLLFKSPEALKIKCDAYFELMDAKQRPYIISGLAVYLNTSRQTLLNYEERDEYFDTIREAKNKCEAYAEEQLYIGKNPHGVQFAMKNNFKGWRDKNETELTGKDGKDLTLKIVQYGNNPTPSISAEKLPDSATPSV